MDEVVELVKFLFALGVTMMIMADLERPKR